MAAFNKPHNSTRYSGFNSQEDNIVNDPITNPNIPFSFSSISTFIILNGALSSRLEDKNLVYLE
jgi:hypothetical protein